MAFLYNYEIVFLYQFMLDKIQKMKNTENFFTKKNCLIPGYRYSKNISVIFNFFDDVDTGIIEIDIKGYIKKINSRAAFLLGSTPQEAIHQVIWSNSWLFYSKNRVKLSKTKNPIFLGLKKKYRYA